MTTQTEAPNTQPARATGLKSRLKQAVQNQPALWSTYWRAKQQIRRIFLLRYFLHDIRNTYHAMYWSDLQTDQKRLAANLLFSYHKLEKGLVMPGPRRMFGAEPALATLTLCRRWLNAGCARTDPVFVGALETLAAYARRLQEHSLDQHGVVLPQVLSFLKAAPERNPELTTPQTLPGRVAVGSEKNRTDFTALALARRSVREFTPTPVPASVLNRAVQAAQLSPSACNRQPCRVHVISSEADKQRLLGHQNGNRGFGHLAPQVVILTADEHCFFDASERHEPYVDGGMFAMSFILSLRDQGVGSCCLNWCVPPATDHAVHNLFSLPSTERIVMLIAIGYEPEDCLVPRSPRRSTEEVLQVHHLAPSSLTHPTADKNNVHVVSTATSC